MLSRSCIAPCKWAVSGPHPALHPLQSTADSEPATAEFLQMRILCLAEVEAAQPDALRDLVLKDGLLMLELTRAVAALASQSARR